MKYKAQITVMPLEAILDPQGKTVTKSMKNLGLNEIQNVRIGKHITLEVDCDSKEKASAMIEEACRKLLSNPIMESYTFELAQLN